MIAIRSGASRPYRSDGGEYMTPVSSNLTTALRLQWSRRFAGTPRQVACARHWIQELLPSCSAQQDLVTIASELAANAVKHTRSQRQGGVFSVEISWNPDVIRLVVGDQGSPTPPVVVIDSDGIGGLGLFVVSKLAQKWGVTGGEDGRNVWADIPWNHGGDPVQAVLAVLRHQYPEASAWYGASSAESTHERRAAGTAKPISGFSSPGRAVSGATLIRRCQDPRVAGDLLL